MNFGLALCAAASPQGQNLLSGWTLTNMNKITKILILLSLFTLPVLSFASTVYFSPTSISVQPGQLVTINVIVDPQGIAYTAKVAVSFPPGLLSVSSFSQASGWLPLTQHGYDSTDNSSGSLIKTGGMAGGLSSAQAFGTVTFVAKSAGVANISVTSSTQILNSQSQNTFTGGGQVSINISQPAPAPVVVPTTPPKNTPPASSPTRKLLTPPTLKAVTTTPIATTTVSSASGTSSSENLELTAQVAEANANSEFLLNIVIPTLTFALGFALAQRLKTL